VLKLPGEEERALVEQRFALRRATAYVSYAWMNSSQFPHWDDVVVAEQPDERCLDLYEQQGHGSDWVRSIFDISNSELKTGNGTRPAAPARRPGVGRRRSGA
jgi:hypothetical protein